MKGPRPPTLAALFAAVEHEMFGSASEPQAVGRYRLGALLGSGAHGLVFRAFDPLLRRDVAIKLVHAALADANRWARRFKHEAQALARCAHPNILPIYDFGVLDDASGSTFYAVTELLIEGDLERWLRARPRTWREVVRRMCAAGRGLAAAHERGVVHRDFKMSNVLLAGDDTVKVADFGFAKMLESRSPFEIAGTPRYMAPELASGEAPSPASDQFAFCKVAVDALDSARRSRLDHAAPVRIRALLARGTELAPSERWPSMAELVRAVERVLSRPSWSRTSWIAASGGAAAIGCLRVLAVSPEPCEFVEPTRAFAVPDVTDYGERWLEACRTVESTSVASTDERRRCLERGRIAFERRLGSPTPGLDVRTELASLPAPELCTMDVPTSSDRFVPTSHELAAEVELHRQALLEVHASIQRGRYYEAVRGASAVTASAERLGYAPLRAEARQLLGRSLSLSDEPERAVEELEAATFEALALGHDDVVVAAIGDLLYALGSQLERHAEAERWVEHAWAAERRMAVLHPDRARLHNALGGLAYQQRNYATAVAEFVAAAAISARFEPLLHSLALGNLGGMALELGALDVADRYLNDALRIRRSRLGPAHPTVGYALLGVGRLAELRATPEVARRHYADAVVAFESTLDDRHGAARLARQLLEQTR